MKANMPPPLPAVHRQTEPRRFPVCSAQDAANRIHKRCAPCECTVYGEGKHTVILLPEAWSELSGMICFGKRRAVNYYEQQYQGMGHFYVSETGKLNIIISHVLYIYSADRGRTHAAVIRGADTSFLDLLASERAIYNQFEAQFNRDEAGRELDPFLREGASEVVLFGHTHPDLGVFFSGPDRNSSYAAMNFPAVTFVCDPIRKQMKAMVGIEEADARVLVFSYAYGKNEQPPARMEAAGNAIPKKTAVESIAPAPATPEIAQPVPPVRVEAAADGPLEAELGKVCTALLAEKYVKGKFRVYRGLWGTLHVEFVMKRRIPRKTAPKSAALEPGGR
ncbi:MAG: hypothetical protein ABFC31_09305 [Clostridiaceae bacterium]